MAYEPTIWKDRSVEKPRTFNVQNNPDGTVTLVPVPGAVVEAGTPVNAVNLNKLEQGLKTHEDKIATQEELGHVKVDGLTIVIDSNGIISAYGAPTILYKEGNEYSDITGGWIAGAVSGNYNISKEIDHLFLSVSNNPTSKADAVYRTVNKISLTDIKELNVLWEKDGGIPTATIRITDSTGLTPVIAQQFTTDIFEKQTTTLDVSTLNGEYYIQVGILDAADTESRDGVLKVYRIWGVK